MKDPAPRKDSALRAAERRTSNIERRTSKEKLSEIEYDLEDRLLEFAARIIRLVDALYQTRAGNHVAGQVLRSGTSPLPNHGEAQAAESRSDFIHKFKVCLKELRETHRWLRLIKLVPLINKPSKVDALLTETDELIRIFVASLRSAGLDGSLTVREDAPSTFDVRRSTFDVQLPAGPVEPASPSKRAGRAEPPAVDYRNPRAKPPTKARRV